MAKAKGLPDYLILLIIIVLAFISRLPQVLGSGFFIDGDESVVGLMAKHMSEGNGFPVYFYGQKYGFALFETLPAALAFKIFGVSLYTLKLCMLLIWSIGLFFFFKAFRLISGNTAAWLMVLLLLSVPAWAVWSMKARGGYNTAFFFSALILYFIAINLRNLRQSRWQYFYIGLMLAVIYSAQALWLPAIMPFIIYLLIKHKSYQGLLLMITGGVVAYISILGLAAINPNGDYWHPKFFGDYSKAGWQSIEYRVHGVLHGTFSFNNEVDVGRNVNRVTDWWIIGIYILFYIQLIRIFTRHYFIYSHLFFLGILLTLSYCLFLNPEFYSSRHLLPLPQLIAAGMALEFSTLFRQGVILKYPAMLAATLLIIFGFIAQYEFKNMDEEGAKLAPGLSRIKECNKFIKSLSDQNVHHFVGINVFMRWQLMFMSNETLIGRPVGNQDRYPGYIKEVNIAHKAGKHIVIIGTGWEMDYYIKKWVPVNEWNRFYCTATDICALMHPEKDVFKLDKTGEFQEGDGD